MSDINNNGTDQYDHSKLTNEDVFEFDKLVCRNIKDVKKRKEILDLFIEKENSNDKKIGDS